MKKENYLIGNSKQRFVKEIVRQTLFLFITICSLSIAMGQVAINEDDSDADARAALDVKSTKKGMLFPSMSSAARDALKSPAAGLLIYNISTSTHNYYDGTNWRAITTETAIPATNPGTLGTDVGVGIGIDDPDNSAMLQVSSSTKGFLLPRGNIIPPITNGAIFYTPNDGSIRVCDGGAYQAINSSIIGIAATGSETAEGVLIGSGTIANSAAFEVRSGTKHLLIPRMGNGQRDAIPSPAEGLTIYNTQVWKLQFYSNFNWYSWVMGSVPPPSLTTETFNNTGTGAIGNIQNFTVPAGIFAVIIEAWGAQGGSSTDHVGGKGARMKGTFEVTPGDVFQIAVGQQGTNTTTNSSGGGGGSFVYNQTTSTLLLVAGGGGGAGGAGIGLNGLITEAGGQDWTATNAGGTGGNGGPEGPNYSGAGGAGFFTNGADGNLNSTAIGGKSWANGLFGGDGGAYNGTDGGYGGGGGADYSPGGGGGYSGGASFGSGDGSTRQGAGGGGSYNVGTNQSNASGVQTGHGQVTISY